MLVMDLFVFLLVEVSEDLSLLASSSMASSLTSTLLTLLSMVSNVIFVDLAACMIAESLSTFEALSTYLKRAEVRVHPILVRVPPSGLAACRLVTSCFYL